MEPPRSTQRAPSDDLESLVETIKEGGPAADNLLQAIPLDILVIIILDHLSGQDIYALCRTSPYFNQRFCSADPRHIWEQLWRRDISSTEIPSNRHYQATYIRLFELEAVDPKLSLKTASENGYEKYVLSHLPTKEEQRQKLIKWVVRARQLSVTKALYNRGFRSQSLSFVRVAAVNDDTAFLDQILADATNAPLRYTLHNEALLGAVEGDHLELFRELIDSDTNLSAYIIPAIHFKSYSIIRELIQQGIPARDLLAAAASGSDIETVQFVLDQAPVKRADIELALEAAVTSDFLDRPPVVKFLLRLGADTARSLKLAQDQLTRFKREKIAYIEHHQPPKLVERKTQQIQEQQEIIGLLQNNL